VGSHRRVFLLITKRAVAVALCGALAAALLLSPVKVCVVAWLLHVPCPGCGLTRAALAMARGDFARATALHPLAIVLVPLVALVLGRHALSYVRTGSAWTGTRANRWSEYLGAALVFSLLFVWIARFFGFWGGPVPV
jgi:hypothetical protein